MAIRTAIVGRAVAALAASVLGLGVLAGQATAEDKRPLDGDVVEWVQNRVLDWQPTVEDRRFDEIGWARDVRDAERLAKENHRPVFLFTHNGHMAVGRC